MKLHWSPYSPFVRKVMIALYEKEMHAQVEQVRSKVVFAAAPNPAVMHDNPLGKIPTLILDDGTPIFDSHVICEYLDMIRPHPRLFPEEPAERLRQLRWEALADGLLDSLLLLRIEAQRGDRGDPVIVASLASKIEASMRVLDRQTLPGSAEPLAVGAITTVCVLGYLDFRCWDSGWRDAWPSLAAWYDAAATRHSCRATVVTEASTEPSLPLSFSGVRG